MSRCRVCSRLIWPWERRGWTVELNGARRLFHARCYDGPRRPVGPRVLRITLRTPIVLRRREAVCAVLGCGLYAEAGEHATTPEECFGKRAMGCHDPAAHHRFRAAPWWRRLEIGGGW